MPTTFPTDNMTPRLVTVDTSLTRASIRGFTKQDFEDQQFKEVGLDRIIAGTKEGRMAGVKVKPMMDLILSRMRPKKASEYPSIIQPWRLQPRRNRVNVGFFQIEAGAAHGSAGAPGYHSGLWNLTVNVGSSPWVGNQVSLPSGATLGTTTNKGMGSQGAKNLKKFFLKDQFIHVEWVAGGVAKHQQFKVVASADATAAGVEKAVITVEPCYASEAFAALTDKTSYQPAAGQVNMLANSVSNYQSWGYQKPAWNDYTLMERWKQTMRWCHSWNEEYVKALAAPYTSDFLKKFQLLPLAQQRRLQQEQVEDEFFNTYWFGDRINENQTIANWTNLPKVPDISNPGMTIEYQSNTLGVITQLYEAGMVQDGLGTPLNLLDIFKAGYYLRRTRGSDVIDCFTDRETKWRIYKQMVKYYKAEYGVDNVQMFITPGKELDFNGLVKWDYDLYRVPNENYSLAIFTDDSFDDKLASFHASQKNRGRSFVMVDWSDVHVNVLNSMSVQRTTNEHDELYRYVMAPVKHYTQMNSQTIEVEVEDPNRHLVIHNFNDELPIIS